MVSAGEEHSCATQEGALYCWGQNEDGILGLGHADPVSSPGRVGVAESYQHVEAGARASCALDARGSVYCFGDNALGELGVGDFERRALPTEALLAARVVQLSMNHSHACAVSEGGELHCWGQNYEGQLGQNDGFPGENSAVPLRVGTASDWRFVDTGQGHSCGIREPGALYCWGRNTDSELGLGSGAESQIRVPTRVGMEEDWIQISLGQSHGCGLRSDGSLWCWGSSMSLDPLVTPAWQEPARVLPEQAHQLVTSGTFSNCSLVANGALYCFGRAVEGQLGVGETADFFEPRLAMPDGPWKSVSAGRFHHCAVDVGDVVHCTGDNGVGQLGTGDSERRQTLTPIVFP
jgi:alpha-tubulin suppressor-like RCC1 family protein